MTKDILLNALSGFKEKKVLVLGDIMLDEYHWCQVNRISPEAPVPVCTVSRTTLSAGGAANVAMNTSVLGQRTYLSGIIGQDSSGQKLKGLLNTIDTSGLLQDPQRPTILKSRIMAHQQHVARVDREDISPICEILKEELKQFLTHELPDSDVVILSDYLKGTLPNDFLKWIIDTCHRLHKRIVIDPKGDDYIKYKGATLLTPNSKEFETAIGKKIKNEEEILQYGQELIKTLSLEALLITRSEKGMSLISKTQKQDIPTKAKEVFDITGAGDTVIATLAVSLAHDYSLETSALLANYAASVAVSKIGTSAVSLSEISQAILHDF